MFKALKGLDYGKDGNNTPDFSRHVEHHGYNRRVIVAVDDEAHVTEFPAEVGGVLRKLSDPFNTWKRQIKRGTSQYGHKAYFCYPTLYTSTGNLDQPINLI